MNNFVKIAGIVLFVSMVSGCSMKSMMVTERVSPYGVEETIKKIQENAVAIGWVSPAVKNMNKSIKKHGGKAISGKVRIVELCNAQHASKILSDDEARYSALLMPCAIAVYSKKDGKTYVANMKAEQMGNMMGGTVADVMSEVDADQQKILKFME